MIESRPDLVSSMMMLAQITKNSLIIQTGGNTIIGTPILSGDELDADDFIKIAIDAYKQTKQSLKNDSEDHEKSMEKNMEKRQLVWLKDVVISGTSNINLPFMVVFISEITGISIGNQTRID